MHRAIGNALRGHDAKSATHVLDARFAIETDLRMGRPMPDQDVQRRLPKAAGRCFNAARAISSAWLNRRSRRLEECNGTGTTLANRAVAKRKLLNAVRQQLAQRLGRGNHSVVLQQVNQVAQAGLVFAVGDRPVELRGIVTTRLTLSVADEQLRRSKSLAAKNTLRHANGLQGRSDIRDRQADGIAETSGVLQRRQSEGKKTAERPLTTVLKGATRLARGSTR